MKQIFLILLLAIAFSATAQPKQNLGIIPTPQQVEIADGYFIGHKPYWEKASKIKVDTLSVERNAEQAYQIIVEKKRITVKYTTADGWNNAYYTMQQLEALYDTLPCMTITDWPAFRWRLWMDDISRGPVVHYNYSFKQQYALMRLKMNAYTYYTEHTLYQSEYPDLAPAYANAERNPSLGAHRFTNLQLFAHAEKTLRIPFYHNIMDSKANFNPDVAETYTFLRKRIAEAIRQVPSNYFIINCDETEQLGTGRARSLVDKKGADQVYVDFINKCYSIVNDEYRAKGHKGKVNIAMWGDIVAKNPEMMRQLPDDMIYIMWAYEPLDSFKQLIKPFKEQGNPFWVAASTGHSATMTSTPQRYIKNIANLFRDGYRDGAEGAMLTCWDDNGEALFDNSWHAQFWAAEMAWNPLKTDDPNELKQREELFNRNFERLYYNCHETMSCETLPETKRPTQNSSDDKATRLTSQLYDVGALMYNPTIGDWYTSAALLEPLLNFNPTNVGDGLGTRPADVAKLVDNINVDSAANPHAHYALKRIELTALKAQLRDNIHSMLNGSNDANTVKQYASRYLSDLFDLKREYLRLWDQENGDYERYIVMNRYDDLAREVLDLDRHVFVELVSSDGELPLVKLRTIYNDRPIYFTLDGSEPTTASPQYNTPFPLERSATIRAISYNEFGEGVITEQYLLSHLAMSADITLNTKYSDYKAIYSAGGDNALIDGLLGSNSTYADGHWQGYWGVPIDVVLDFQQIREIHKVSARFMQNTFDWILAPTEIELYTSADGINWHLLKRESFPMDPRETGMRLHYYSLSIDPIAAQEKVSTTRKGKSASSRQPQTRYLRVVVPNPGVLPDWHPAPKQPSYLFCDEIVVE